MTDKTHQLIGITAATGAVLWQQPDLQVTWPVAATVLLGAVIGSVTPDLDQPTANLWDEFPLGRLLGKITSRALGGHRNLSHSLLGAVLFAILLLWLTSFIPDPWWLDTQLLRQSAMIGFLAHLAADAVTVMGIPLLWPFGRNMGFPPYPLHGARIVTGKWFENLVVLPLVFILLVTLISLHTERFCPIFFVACG